MGKSAKNLIIFASLSFTRILSAAGCEAECRASPAFVALLVPWLWWVEERRKQISPGSQRCWNQMRSINRSPVQPAKENNFSTRAEDLPAARYRIQEEGWQGEMSASQNTLPLINRIRDMHRHESNCKYDRAMFWRWYAGLKRTLRWVRGDSALFITRTHCSGVLPDFLCVEDRKKMKNYRN